MSAAAMFAVMARSGRDNRAPTVTGYPPRVTQDGQGTFVKLCPRCKMQMPHKVGDPRCVLCMMDERNDVESSGQDDDHG